MASESQGKKPRNYYVDYTKNDRFRNNRGRGGGPNRSRFSGTPDISFGNKGFLITSLDEVKSYLEMRNIFESYYEKLYQKKDDKDCDSKGTVEDELESELKELRKTRPFKQVKTHCRNTLFINILNEFSSIDPTHVVDNFFQDLSERRELMCTNTFKVMPILDTFRNSISCAKESVSNIILNVLNDESQQRTYFIEFQSRGNYKLNSDDKQKWIENIATKIAELRPEWKVDRENAYYMIVLIALKDVCCITFLKEYFKRSKYNVVEYCKDFIPSSKPSFGEEGGEKVDNLPEDKATSTSS